MLSVEYEYDDSFDDNKFWTKFVQKGGEGLRDAAREFYETCREVVNEPYPPASLPGEAPRRRTGRGRDAIYMSRTKSLTGTGKKFYEYEVGVDWSGYYLGLLNLGMINDQGYAVEARPWLDIAWEKSESQIISHLEKSINMYGVLK